jgi:putative ABC transport system permease protein
MNKKEIFETRENEREKGFLNRGINITYTDKLGPHERIIKGKPLPTTWNSFKNVPISLEKRYARRLDIELGDTLVFDILGLEISTVVQNFREVDWISFYPNFFIQFPLGVFDDAPKTFLAVLSELDIETRKKFIQVSSKEFPNIPVINLKHIIEKVIKIFDFISLSLKIMSLLCFIVASFIILNLIYEKILIELKDYSLLRLIGVKKKELIKMVSKEVLILLLGAIVLSILGTLGINFGVNYFVFNSYFLKIPIIVLWVNLFLCMMIFMGIYILLRYQLKKEIKQNLFY